MRIVFVAIAILCLALAPCVAGRSLSSTDSSLVDTRFNEDETLLHVQEVNRYPSALDRSSEWFSLKKSRKNRRKKNKKNKPFRWGGQPPSLWAFVFVIAFSVIILLLLWACVAVTEKKEKEPNWHLRTFLRRKLKHEYTIKGVQARMAESRKKSGKLASDPFDEQNEKPDVEKKVPAADVVTDTVKPSAT